MPVGQAPILRIVANGQSSNPMPQFISLLELFNLLLRLNLRSERIVGSSLRPELLRKSRLLDKFFLEVIASPERNQYWQVGNSEPFHNSLCHRGFKLEIAVSFARSNYLLAWTSTR